MSLAGLASQMEGPEKRRRVEEEEATDLMSLPRDMRFELIYMLPTIEDVQALCMVNKTFSEWCIKRIRKSIFKIS